MRKIQFMFAVVVVSMTIGAAVPATAAPGTDIKNAGGAAAFADPAIFAAHGCTA